MKVGNLIRLQEATANCCGVGYEMQPQNEELVGW